MVDTYKCPGCGAPLYYKPGEEELVCAYCNTHTKVSELGEEDRYDSQSVSEVQEEEEPRGDFEGYVCRNCGAELLTDEYTTATVCCYCGSPALISEKLTGVIKPSGVIPFRLTKEQAKETFRKWVCRGLFTPSVFKKTASIENVRGIYVPFWLYDYEADIHAEGEGKKVSIEYGNDMKYTHSEYYYIKRDGHGSYHGIPVDASKHMDDELMDAMEPFVYGEMKEFEMPYLSGFESEKYNFESNDTEMTGRIEGRVNEYIFQDMKDTIHGYSSVRFTKNQVSLTRKAAKYVLLPIWILTYRYKGENKIFAMNGQTGKQVGTLPNSPQKMLTWFFGIAGVIATGLWILGGLLG